MGRYHLAETFTGIINQTSMSALTVTSPAFGTAGDVLLGSFVDFVNDGENDADLAGVRYHLVDPDGSTVEWKDAQDSFVEINATIGSAGNKFIFLGTDNDLIAPQGMIMPGPARVSVAFTTTGSSLAIQVIPCTLRSFG